MSDVLSAALAYLDSGLSIIPTVKATKKPLSGLSWKAFQVERATPAQATTWFQNGACIAVIGGTVSGNLEVIDFDQIGVATQWRKLLVSWNCQSILDKLVIERSQRGGHHVAYRHQGRPEGNQKLAQRPATEAELSERPTQLVKGMIETRGEGGYCLVAPSEGYTLKQGDWRNLPLLTADEREILLNAARTFDEMPKYQPSPQRGSARPGEDFNIRARIEEIIEPLGWTHFGGPYWTRPGKPTKDGPSASWDYHGNGHFVVFSTNTPLDAKAYDLFQLYTAIHHNGDFAAAAKDLAGKGYGEKRQPKPPATRREHHAPEPLDESPPEPRKWHTFDLIVAKEVPWLLYPYIPLGIGYVLAFGDSGIGKSTSILSIISKFSNGIDPITGADCDPIRSIILSAEDSAEYVVKPRLEAFGANMANIMAPEEFGEDGTANPLILGMAGVEELRVQVRAFGAKIVMIDPLTAYFDGDSMNDRLQARSWCKRVHNLAVTENCAPIVVHHVNKATGMQGRYRASGSQDFFDGCRSALMAVRGGADSDEYALVHEKHNLSPKGDSIGYTFTKEDGFQWTGVSDMTSDMAAAAFEEHVPTTKVGACSKWILEQLESYGEKSAKDLEAGCKAEGFSRSVYNKAREKLRDQVRSYQIDREWWAALREFDRYAD